MKSLGEQSHYDVLEVDREAGPEEIERAYRIARATYTDASMATYSMFGDEEARAEYIALTGGRRGVPVIVVGDAWMQGWSPPEFDRLYAATR